MWEAWIRQIILNERIPLRWIFAVPLFAFAALFIVHGCMYPFSLAADLVVGTLLIGLGAGVLVLAHARAERRRR